MRASFALATAVLTVAVAHGVARAHFDLQAPAVMLSGQKTAPCGGGADSGAITTVAPGSMLTVTIRETITHGGHYRVALAPDVASLPADPAVQGTCASATIDPNPQMPVLADGLFVHAQNQPFSGPQTTQVQLPAGFTCDNCILQVIEFMTPHGAPCFYYRCARLRISNDAPDAGVPPGGDDAGVTDPGNDPAGGCCDANSSPATGLLGFGLVGAALFLRRRRRS